jgi:hypothetical protein
MEPLPVAFRFRRERDHDAARRAVEALSDEVVRRGGEARAVPGGGVELSLHPALPPLWMALREGGVVEARGSGWPGGPGFLLAWRSIALAVASAAEVELEVVEGAGERDALERACGEALGDAARRALAFLDATPLAHLQLGLPRPGRLEALRLAGDPPGIYTLEGRRDRAWLENLAAGGDPRGFFPWWSDPLDDAGAQRLGRALVEAHLTWARAADGPAGDRQRTLRKRALAELQRGEAPPELAALRGTLARLESGEPATIDALRHGPRVAALAGGWAAIVPGHFETSPPAPAPLPPGVVPAPLHGDGAVRIEAMAQEAPPGSFAERAERLFAQPIAAQAGERRRDDAAEVAGYAIERPTGDGTTLLASLVGARTHLIARITVAAGANPEAARLLFRSIGPAPGDERFFSI